MSNMYSALHQAAFAIWAWGYVLLMLNDINATVAFVTERDLPQMDTYKLAQQHTTWPVCPDQTAQAAHGSDRSKRGMQGG